MKTLEISQAVDSLSQYARRLNGEPLVLTEAGRPVAALMPIDEADLESIALQAHPKFWEVIEQARAEHRAGAGLSSQEVRGELGLD
jgi:antitoxin (DNA-binding transcriptional repressor) of toxin-antitoxin stability system